MAVIVEKKVEEDLEQGRHESIETPPMTLHGSKGEVLTSNVKEPSRPLGWSP